MSNNKSKLFREYFSIGVEQLCNVTAKIKGYPFGCYMSTKKMVHFNGFDFTDRQIILTSHQNCTIITICENCKKELEAQIMEMENQIGEK